MSDTAVMEVQVALDDQDSEALADTTEPVSVEPGDLENTDVSERAYDVRAKGVLDKIANLVGFDAKITKVGVIQETKKFTVRPHSGDPAEEEVWGVSTRLLVAATGWDSKVKVTVPVVAASVELGFRNAHVKIQVRGYDGDLGGLLPAPSALNVSSYAKYIAAFEKIQKKVMSDEANQKPVLLEKRPVGHGDDDR